MDSCRGLKAIAVLIISFSIACSANQSDQDVRAEAFEISLNPYVGRLVTVQALAGEDTLTLLLDTGGGETFIVPDVGRRLGCIPSGRSVGYRMTGEMVEFRHCPDISLSIGGVSFPHGTIGVWDINSVLPEGLPRLDGYLSLKTFQKHPFTLELSSKRLVIETRDDLEQRIQTMTRVESRMATGLAGSELTIFLKAKIRDRDYGWFLLDSGNLDVVLVPRHFAADEPVDTSASSGVWESDLALGHLSPVSA